MSAKDTLATSAAALKQPQFVVDADGQATYRIEIEVPRGIAGAQPALTLAFRHSSPNDVLGVGWVLEGLSAITRAKATYAVDGFNGAVAYDGNDRLVLDGQRLINVDGEYWTPGAMYRTELETWSQVRAGGSQAEGFTVVTKEGAKREYGTSVDSRILAAGGDDVRVWALSATADLQGNRVEYHYTLAPGGVGVESGGYYIDRIAYTARADGTRPNRFIAFSYEPRPDPIVTYIGGHQVALHYRMTAITVTIGEEVVRTYTIGYRTSTATALSLIETITQSGGGRADASVLAPTIFTWQDTAQPGFEIGPGSTLNQHLGTPDVRSLDVRGTGRSDLVQLWFDPDRELHVTTYLATDTPAGTSYDRNMVDSKLGPFGNPIDIMPMDLNGDGSVDLIVAYAPEQKLRLAAFLSDGDGGYTAAEVFEAEDWDERTHLRFFAMDANGDGRTDLVQAYSHHDESLGDLLYLRTYLSLFGSGGTFTAGTVSQTEDPAVANEELAFWPIDLNGDGMVDLARVWQAADQTTRISSYLSTSKGIDDISILPGEVTNLETLSLADQVAFLPVDVNGDGIQDLLQIWMEPGSSGTTLHFTTFLSNAAGKFVRGPDSEFSDRSLSPGSVFPMDIDGSGATAVLAKWTSGNRLMFTQYGASPSGAYRALPAFDAGPAGSVTNSATFLTGDVNADGKADLIRVTRDQNEQLRIVPYVSAGDRVDLLSSAVNPLGGRVEIRYAPLSDDKVYSASDALSFPAADARRYSNTLTPAQAPAQSVLGGAVYVVSSVTESAASTKNRFPYESRKTFTYAGARIDLSGRGWQGFRQMSMLEATTGQLATNTREQDFPYTGRLAASSLSVLPGADPRAAASREPSLLTRREWDYTQRTTATGATAPRPPVVQVLRTASRAASYDYGADRFDYQLGHAFSHDQYGNEILDTNLGYIDPKTRRSLYPADVVHCHRQFQNDLTDDGWALGYLHYEKVTANAEDPDITTFGPGDYHLMRRTWTPATYDLASEGPWSEGAGGFITTTYEYDRYGNRATKTTPGDRITRYEFDPEYHTYLMSETTPPNEYGTPLTVSYGYDPRFGVEVARIDANGNVWINALDSFGRRVGRQTPLPGASGATDPVALPPLVTGTEELKGAFTSAKVVTTEKRSYLDDGGGGLFSEISVLQSFPVGSERQWVAVRHYVDGRGRGRQTVQETGQTAGNTIVLTDYDANDKPVLQSVPFFSTADLILTAPHAITTRYDGLVRPIEQHSPAGPTGEDAKLTTWAYHPGQRVRKTSAAGTSAAVTEEREHHFYDGHDRVRRVTVDPDGEAAVTSFEFDAIGRLRRATDPGGVANTLTYDSLDNRLTLDNPDQNTSRDPSDVAMTYAYDPVTGLLLRRTDAADDITTLSYDGLERVVRQHLPDGRVVVRAYDDPAAENSRGLLSRVTVLDKGGVPESDLRFSYDTWGNPVSKVLTVAGEPAPLLVRRVFDPEKRVIHELFPDGTAMTREYQFGRLVTQTLAGARIDYPLESFSAWGNAGEIRSGDGVVTTYIFNPSGQAVREVLTAAGETILDVAYTYDPLDQLTAASDARTVENSQAFTYANRRLTSAKVPGFDDSAYAYDKAGNLLEANGVTYDHRAHFPVTGSVDSKQVYAATQDACGRTASRTTDGTTLGFGYDGFGSLCRVATDTGEIITEMLSDHAGQLLRRTDADGVTLLVDAAYELTRATTGEEKVTRRLLDDRGCAAEITGPAAEAQVSYYRRDFKGNNSHSFGPTGVILTQISYDGYGRSQLMVGDDIARKYENRAWDARTGLYYFGARYYDPIRGRFLTPDTRLGSDNMLRPDIFNRFAFELNNPINSVDPTGHLADWEIGLIVAAAIVVVGVAILLTGGLAAPVVGVAAEGAAGSEAVGALAEGAFSVSMGTLGGAAVGAGVSTGVYSATHRDVSGGTFWKGWAINFAVGFVVGGATGAATSVFSVGLDAAAGYLSVGNQMLLRAALIPVGMLEGGGGAVFSQFMSNVTDHCVLGKDVSLDSGLVLAAAVGAVAGGVGGGLQGAGEVAYLDSTRVVLGKPAAGAVWSAFDNTEMGRARFETAWAMGTVVSTIGRTIMKTSRNIVLLGVAEAGTAAATLLEWTVGN
jgi:RHS repeat-associated protein